MHFPHFRHFHTVMPDTIGHPKNAQNAESAF